MVYATGGGFGDHRNARRAGLGISCRRQSKKEGTEGRARISPARPRLGESGTLEMKRTAAVIGLGLVGRAHLDSLRFLRGTARKGPRTGVRIAQPDLGN